MAGVRADREGRAWPGTGRPAASASYTRPTRMSSVLLPVSSRRWVDRPTSENSGRPARAGGAERRSTSAHSARKRAMAAAFLIKALARLVWADRGRGGALMRPQARGASASGAVRASSRLWAGTGRAPRRTAPPPPRGRRLPRSLARGRRLQPALRRRGARRLPAGERASSAARGPAGGAQARRRGAAQRQGVLSQLSEGWDGGSGRWHSVQQRGGQRQGRVRGSNINSAKGTGPRKTVACARMARVQQGAAAHGAGARA
jgi:hypothetical protein